MITGKFWGQRLAEMTKDSWLGSLLCWYYIEGVSSKSEWQGIVKLAKKNNFLDKELDSFFAKNWEMTPEAIEDHLSQVFDQAQESHKQKLAIDSEQIIETAFRIRQNFWQQLKAHIQAQYQEEQLKAAS